MINRKHDTKLRVIMMISIIMGLGLIVVAEMFNIVIYVYILSIFINIFMFYILPEKLSTRFNKEYLNRVTKKDIVLLPVILLGPIMPIFILISTFKKIEN